ncbi:amino acid ABC transporter permease (plasmid) [Azospirillum baldaniorum]|uniref:Amino acid ABC transporter, permease component n=4 Tax=Azospirillum TaxID=191 RepID=A0A9P1JU57_9PROT|nr:MULTISPECIES: amino acid ABC transporter permease [Azospirillum]AWJ91524.1 amino acid ABC transporter permease [Azospirillum baldaniorum]MBB3263952.1 polar amino acid transport system permease protein [Azospirillum sp. OGB3]MBK3733834.1 ABC transporter permease subunit [Azospirillum brasilense]NUB22185.1 ABC transporter permease subunit [Azospirillum formosense]TWA70819.1 amino acid ABC transporter membrane protein 2 (PAAT family) [Azospirillum baldaniorum]
MIRAFSYNEFLFLLSAVQWTLALSAIAFIGGATVGLVIALARTSDIKAVRLAATGYIQLFQGTPLLMQLFLVFFGATVMGLDLNPWAAAALGLTLNASAFLGEIWRGCIQAVPRGQWEAASALGLRYPGLMRYVILPQAVKVAVPPTVGFLVQLIKSTSLAAIIGFTELTRAGQIVNNATFQPFLVFGIVAVLYFLMCWPLSLLSARLERRYALATR